MAEANEDDISFYEDLPALPFVPGVDTEAIPFLLWGDGSTNILYGDGTTGIPL